MTYKKEVLPDALWPQYSKFWSIFSIFWRRNWSWHPLRDLRLWSYIISMPNSWHCTFGGLDWHLDDWYSWLRFAHEILNSFKLKICSDHWHQNLGHSTTKRNFLHIFFLHSSVILTCSHHLTMIHASQLLINECDSTVLVVYSVIITGNMISFTRFQNIIWFVKTKFQDFFSCHYLTSCCDFLFMRKRNYYSWSLQAWHILCF